MLVEIYTDGSCLFNASLKHVVAAWGVVIVHHFLDGSHRAHGFCCGHVAPLGHEHALRGIHPSHGTQLPDSCAAAAEAIFRELTWVLQSDLFHLGIEHQVVSDAMTFISSAEALCQFQARPFVSKQVRPLYEAAVAIGPLKSKWQKAHCGQEYDELADQVAKEAARDPDMAIAPALFNQKEVHLLPWLWYHWRMQLDPVVPTPKLDHIAFP